MQTTSSLPVPPMNPPEKKRLDRYERQNYNKLLFQALFIIGVVIAFPVAIWGIRTGQYPVLANLAIFLCILPLLYVVLKKKRVRIRRS